MSIEESSRVAAGTESTPLRLIVGNYVDPCGVSRAKSVPSARLKAFSHAGMGASPSWAVFCPDDQIAFSETIGVVGDLRLRLDETSLRHISTDTAWGAVTMETQDGEPVCCPRSALQRIAAQAERDGYTVKVGSEFEFFLLPPAALSRADGESLSRTWHAYGTEALLDREEFGLRLFTLADRAGLQIEQLHCEYGPLQMEVSLPPAAPVDAADQAAVLRTLIKSAAKEVGQIASFSPKPFGDQAGSGAHLHLSLADAAGPLFAGGPGPHGLTVAGEHAMAGILATAAELTAVYAGSPVSPLRLAPNSWSGSAVCWGLENREAALRLCAATLGNPHGANVELKIVDPSANPYLAIAAMLGSALSGIDNQLPLPAEMTGNPAEASPRERELADVRMIPSDYATTTALLKASEIAPLLLGADITAALLATRDLLGSTYAETPSSDLTRQFRTAW